MRRRENGGQRRPPGSRGGPLIGLRAPDQREEVHRELNQVQHAHVVLIAANPLSDNGNMKFRVLNPDGSKPNLMAIALNEAWASQLDPCGMDGFALEEDGTLNLMDRSGRYACPPIDRFRVEMGRSAHVAFLDG